MITTASEQSTAGLAASIIPVFRPGRVLCLRGGLGMGKSVLARGLIRALCRDPDLDVPSPTFTLVQVYDADDGPVWHFDLYRLESPDDVLELGWDDARADGRVIVEWPERLGPLLPDRRLEILFAPGPGGPDSRRIDFGGDWPDGWAP